MSKAKADVNNVYTLTFSYCLNCDERLVLGGRGEWTHQQNGNLTCDPEVVKARKVKEYLGE